MTRWANYTLLSGLHDMPREIQVAQLENCLADDALKILEGFDFPTGEDERTVQEMMMAFERYAKFTKHWKDTSLVNASNRKVNPWISFWLISEY